MFLCKLGVIWECPHGNNKIKISTFLTPCLFYSWIGLHYKSFLIGYKVFYRIRSFDIKNRVFKGYLIIYKSKGKMSIRITPGSFK